MQEIKSADKIQLYQQKYDLLQQFLLLSEQQAAAIQEENYDELLVIIEQKQTVIEKVNLFSPRLLAATGTDDEQLQTIKNQIMEVITRAAALDEQSVQLLRRNQDGVLLEMININKSKKTHAQYRGDNAKIEGVFLDIRQ